MPFNEACRRQVALLLRVLPDIAPEKFFALKGGTAINLFIRDMPRLSVDIDLTYLGIEDRPDSLEAIDAALRRVAERLRAHLPNPKIDQKKIDNHTTTLLLRADGVLVKIEVAPVLRGCVFDPVLRPVSPSVEAAFGFAEIQLLSFADLYAGKIVAALDRQHPRDLFDVRDLLANEGIDDLLRRAFIVYLLSHNRPMFEVLSPHPKDIQNEFARGFEGMTETPVTLAELLAARQALIKDIVGKMPQAHRTFLISFEEGRPEWDLLDVPNVSNLPAVAWRQFNLGKTTPRKRGLLVENLKKALSE